MKNNNNIQNLVLSALFIAIGIVLPFFTGQIPEIGSALLPMHIPVLLCGIICGGKYGLLVGAITPLLRSVLFGMPPMFPTATAMAFELAAYGLVIGIMYKLLAGKNGQTIISLVTSMLLGRIVWGVTMSILLGVTGGAFSFELFVSGAVLGAIPGILLQLILIPVVITLLKRANIIERTLVEE